MGDPEISYTYNGFTKRALHTASYDYLRGPTRIEVKSARMIFDKANQRWKFSFQKIYKSHFDELRLVFLTPGGIYVFVHDGRYGFSQNGEVSKVSGEQNINVY